MNTDCRGVMFYKTLKYFPVLQKIRQRCEYLCVFQTSGCLCEKFNIPQKVGVNWSYQQNWLLHNSIGFSSATFTLFTSNLLLQAPKTSGQKKTASTCLALFCNSNKFLYLNQNWSHYAIQKSQGWRRQLKKRNICI